MPATSPHSLGLSTRLCLSHGSNQSPERGALRGAGRVLPRMPGRLLLLRPFLIRYCQLYPEEARTRAQGRHAACPRTCRQWAAGTDWKSRVLTTGSFLLATQRHVRGSWQEGTDLVGFERSLVWPQEQGELVRGSLRGTSPSSAPDLPAVCLPRAPRSSPASPRLPCLCFGGEGSPRGGECSQGTLVLCCLMRPI